VKKNYYAAIAKFYSVIFDFVGDTVFLRV